MLSTALPLQWLPGVLAAHSYSSLLLILPLFVLAALGCCHVRARCCSLLHGVLLALCNFADDARVGGHLAGARREEVARRRHELALVERAVTKKGAVSKVKILES